MGYSLFFAQTQHNSTYTFISSSASWNDNCPRCFDTFFIFESPTSLLSSSSRGILSFFPFRTLSCFPLSKIRGEIYTSSSRITRTSTMSVALASPSNIAPTSSKRRRFFSESARIAVCGVSIGFPALLLTGM